MPCYSPLRAVIVDGPQGRRLSFGPDARGSSISLPCGRCIGCRLERSRQWAVRIMHEAKMHDDSSFITLTYDEEHFPKSCPKCSPTCAGSLCVCEAQRFVKRLRERIRPTRIKFFLAGEYGEKLGRPHYHAVIFGYGFPDKVLFKRSGEHSLYTSALLSSTWGLGFASLGAVSFDSAAYVASYAVKKVVGPSAKEHYVGRKPEFLVMSRGGRSGRGIGRSFVEKFASDIFPSDEVVVRGISSRPPRYYDQYLLESNPFEWYALKARRAEEASKLEEIVLASGDRVAVSPSRNAGRLKVRETVARAKLSLKRRNLENQ